MSDNLNSKIDKILESAGQNAATDDSSVLETNKPAIEQLKADIEKREKYEDKSLEAAALGAARGLTFGLSDQALTSLGKITGYTPQELNDIKKYNELESTIGEVGGIVVPSVLTGGTGALGATAKAATAGVRAAEATGKVAQKAFAKVLQEQGKKSVAKDIVSRSIPKVLGSAVEGSAYGLGQLVSENALGNADISAENIIASAGTGALLGGAARGIFEAPKLLAPVAKKVGTPVSKKANDFFDRQGAALELIGTTPKKAQKLVNNRPDFVKELPDWLAEKARLKPFTKTTSLEKSISEVRDIAKNQITNVSSRIDDALVQSADTAPRAAEQFLDIAGIINKIEDSKLIKGIGLSKLKQVRASALEVAEKAQKSNKPASASELRQFKQELDDIIPYGSETSKLEVAELKKLRFNVDQKIRDLAQFADDVNGTRLLSEYKNANKDYSFASIILPNLDSKLAKEAAKPFAGFTDTVLGTVTAGALGAAPAAAVLGVKKLAESDLRRRMIILSSIERANRQVDRKINTSIKSFFDKAKSKIPAAAAIQDSVYSLNYDKEKPENRQKAFKNAFERINRLISDPEELQKVVSRRTLHLQPVAPNTTTLAMQTALRGVQFLHSKLPKQASASSTANQFSKRPYQPSELEMSKFERYLQAVENPMSALEQLEAGNLTREAAEAIQVVYPQMFAKMQDMVISELQNREAPVSYSKRLQLGILLNIETDASLSNTNIASLQQNLLPAEPEQTATPARADNIDIADRVETKENRIAQK